MNREQLILYLNRYLQVADFQDFAPNGVQVEGQLKIKRLVTGVTACAALINAAISEEADAILVHHGLFWKNDSPVITGMKYQRLRLLCEHQINLFAYHLPLDVHPELGNNAQLARILEIKKEQAFGQYGLGSIGSIAPIHLADFIQKITLELNRSPLVLGARDKKITKVAWCSGAAQNLFETAVALGADVYLSGEVSEPTAHIAAETGVVYLACGHHATERFGIAALGDHLAEQFSLEHKFIDIFNPI